MYKKASAVFDYALEEFQKWRILMIHITSEIHLVSERINLANNINNC